ncbi:ECF-type sigma factor [Lysobacter sp. CA199]|uniref:ECF-type sigma factor n=1 Tax=Lysobacter sp. CA199 TaxID=3455608 RepID=UPI003F8D1D9F
MSEVTNLLAQARAGDVDSLPRVFALLYAELRKLANSKLRGQEATLTPTVLVHETYLKLCSGDDAMPLESRKHFFAAAAQAMRWILVDDARRNLALRHGGGAVRVELPEDLVEELKSEELLALNSALDSLGRIDPARKELVELRYFAGLEYEELEQLLGRSVRTLKREWASARAALYELMAQ